MARFSAAICHLAGAASDAIRYQLLRRHGSYATVYVKEGDVVKIRRQSCGRRELVRRAGRWQDNPAAPGGTIVRLCRGAAFPGLLLPCAL